MSDTANDNGAHLKKFKKELNSGILSLVLLSILAGAKEEMYGYQIAKQLDGEARGGGAAFKQGTLYPVLRSLAAGGLLDSRVEPSVSGPPRRYYSINDAGREALAQWTRTWTETRKLVDGILKPGSKA